MGQAAYADDLTIADDSGLWRRIPPMHFVFDANLGRMRPSSAAFEDDRDGHPMSIVLADVAAALGRGPDDVLSGHAGFALAKFTAGLARSKQLGIQRDPLPDEPAHALVFGKKTSSARKSLAMQCEWVVSPPGAP